MRAILLCVLCAAIGTASAASAGEVKIAWYGQSMFQIVTPKGAKIILDPHNIEAYRIQPIKADLVLMSHFHNDHNQIEGVIENAKEAKQYNALKKTGPGNLLIDWNSIDEKLADIRFFTVPTYHDEMSGMKAGKNGCWVMDIDGIRIVHLGDLGHQLNKTQLKRFGKVDVLMVPVGGVYTLNGLTAYKVVKDIAPKRAIIPMHYGTAVFDDLLPIKTFLDECKDDEIPIDNLKMKEWFKLDTKEAAPKQARVAVLHYMGPGMGDIKIKGKDRDKEKDKEKEKDKSEK